MPSCLAGESKWSGLLKNWSVVYVGNFVGSVFVACFPAHATGITTSEPWLGATQWITVGKVTKSFWPLFG